jgi:phenylpropionate dioxygenase-like ring-hydroxylating dioxygenase large terminal subunit
MIRETKAPENQEVTEMQRTLPSSAYLSQETFERERERIFAREWFCAGREEALLAPGHFLKVDVAGESVLIVRTRSGELRGFYNVCRHRGSRIVMDDPEPSPGGSGATGRFKGSMVCPYHGWTYGLAGELRLAPFLTESDGLRRAELSLHPVAVEEWGGFVFVCLMPDAAGAERRTLASQLGPVVERTARYPLAELRTAHRITYEVAANWKCIVENFNECYHCGPVHPELCEVVPAFKRVGGADLDWDRGIPHREGATTFTFTGTTDRAPFPGLSQDERTRHKGELIYPNLMLSMSPDHVTVFTLWPNGPGRTVIDCDFLFHPKEMASLGFDPSDAVEFWDLVNRQDWRICESVQQGMSSRVFRFGYYAPMEDLSLDIRRYVGERLGDPAE